MSLVQECSPRDIIEKYQISATQWSSNLNFENGGIAGHGVSFVGRDGRSPQDRNPSDRSRPL
jgi:hypothetical protein